jgi:hypothetical protein
MCTFEGECSGTASSPPCSGSTWRRELLIALGARPMRGVRALLHGLELGDRELRVAEQRLKVVHVGAILEHQGRHRVAEGWQLPLFDRVAGPDRRRTVAPSARSPIGRTRSFFRLLSRM